MSAAALLAEGHARHGAGDLTGAAALYDAVLALEPQHADALHLRGLVASQLGRQAEARAFLERLGDPPHPVFQANYAAVLLALGEPAAALARFERALALAPDFPPAMLGRARALHGLGRYEAAATAFAAILARAPEDLPAQIGRIAALLEAGQTATALALLEASLVARPEEATLLAQQSFALLRLERHAAALEVAERLVALHPQQTEGLWLRAEALRGLGRLGEALVGFGRVLALEPDHLRARIARAATLLDLNRPAEAFELQTALLPLCPEDTALLANQAIALSRLHQPAEALEFCDRALAREPDNLVALGVRPTLLHDLGRRQEAAAAFDAVIARSSGRAKAQARANKGYALLEEGDFAAGLEFYEARRELGDPMLARDFGGAEWTGAEPLDGRSLFIHWEQGLGDVLQFSRYALLAAARAETVWFSVPRQLFGLFGQFVPRLQLLAGTVAPPAFDYRIPLVSLPRAFGTRLESIPAMPGYLRADPARRAAAEARLGPRRGRRIGLAWAGSSTHRNDSQRSVRLASLLPLLALPGDWVSLQREIRLEDRAALGQCPELGQWPELLANFEATAGLIAALDLVITVDTAVAHLAGALGVPCWIMLGARPDFRWLRGRADSPWYPSVRLFRQPRPGDWAGLAAAVAAALNAGA